MSKYRYRCADCSYEQWHEQPMTEPVPPFLEWEEGEHLGLGGQGEFCPGVLRRQWEGPHMNTGASPTKDDVSNFRHKHI
jgi:hypothetical protein